jgi:hypothetical protein
MDTRKLPQNQSCSVAVVAITSVINSKIWAASLETGANDVKDMDLVSGANPELRNEP